MISVEKINIYEKYDFDMDALARFSKPLEREIISDEDCWEIDDILNDLEMLEKGILSKSFQKRINDKLITSCQDDNVISLLKEIALRRADR